MGGFGWHNPFPMTFGGGPTRTERIYAALRSAAGKGGVAESEEGHDALLLRVEARAIAAAESFADRSAMQAFPDRATDLLPYYERLFLLSSDPDASEEDRRQASKAQYTLRPRADLPALAETLRRIDDRFSIVSTPDSLSVITVMGRAFEDLAGTEPFGGGRKSSALPAYSTRALVVALLDLGNGVAPGSRELVALQRAARVLHDLVPAHEQYTIITHLGFTVGESLLGYTGLEEV